MQYFRNTSTGQVFLLNNGQVTQVSAAPAGTVMSQGNFTLQGLQQQYGTGGSGGAPTTQAFVPGTNVPQPGNGQSVSYGANNTPANQVVNYDPTDLASMKSALSGLSANARTTADYAALTDLQNKILTEQNRQDQIVSQAKQLASGSVGMGAMSSFYNSLPAKDKALVQPYIGGQSNNVQQTTVSSGGISTSGSAGGITGVTKQLDPGTTDPQVLALQKFLNANGFPVAASGPGSAGNETSYFGPATQAALQKYQAANNIASSGDPQTTGYGRVGPQTLQSIQTTASKAVNGGGNGTNPGDGVSTLPTTGDKGVDSFQNQLASQLQTLAQGYKIDSTLDPSQHPEIIKQFLDWAHQVVDPQTQQLMGNHIADINADLAHQATQYGYSRDEMLQHFGTDLATEQENAGGAGTAFSGQRGLNENNMVSSTNRNLASLGESAAYNIGSSLRNGAADVGSANASQFNLPNIAGGSVSNTGGSRGTSTVGGNLSYSYDPNAYKVSNFGNAGAQAVNNQQQDYLKQYATLAGNASNTGRSVQDLFGLISGKPASATSLT